ncbi:DUF2194 domain-containing protein [Vallitalea guaymasensis]|uniref:DUF2194 domain-containing protein n=1 Tax=Vallitalea guaymasensis TaxID=1185412 RepID=A0A8J8MFL2_9FIRM|nr:DUF2194 domain-containing protein [Vallitalea guaymasensis]QUH31715.1 DUF2194 domain-containing protein [Vallitalea guaymasensis]
MKNKTVIYIIIILIGIIGIAYGGMHSGYVLKLIKNVNEYNKIENYALLNSQHINDIEKELFEKHLIIYDENSAGGQLVKDNVIKAYEYMKKDYDLIEVKDVKTINQSYETIVVTSLEEETFSSFEDLERYVANGGNAFIVYHSTTDSFINAIFGIEEIGETVESDGILLKDNLLIKSDGYRVNNNTITNSMREVTLSQAATVYAETADSIPFIWDMDYKNGKFMIYNGTSLEAKENRGLLTGALGLLVDDYIYPILNAKICYIDDFPSPVPSGFDENIYRDYGLTIEEFYKRVWWSDILKGAKLYDVKYTGVIIETYNEDVKPPFETASYDTKNNLIMYGRELLKNDGELGFHGYNHQSFAPEGFIKEDLGYNFWESTEDMMGALKEINRYSKEVFPYYNFKVYVPPSNILHPMGRAAIKEAVPSINILASLYLAGEESDAYVQEFEIAKDQMIELPRITYDYINEEGEDWSIYTTINFFGVFSHFIHPDDILDPNRNMGYSWEEMKEQYNEMLKDIKDNYGWLRSMTASQAAEELKKYLQCDVKFVKNENGIYGFMTNFRKDMYFILRTEKEIKKTVSCTVSEIDNNIYLVHTLEPEFAVKF